MKNTILREALMFNATAIFGPILLLGGLGYFLDKYFGTEKKFIFLGIGVAFILTNVLMFRKIKRFIKVSDEFLKKDEVQDIENFPNESPKKATE